MAYDAQRIGKGRALSPTWRRYLSRSYGQTYPRKPNVVAPPARERVAANSSACSCVSNERKHRPDSTAKLMACLGSSLRPSQMVGMTVMRPSLRARVSTEMVHSEECVPSGLLTTTISGICVWTQDGQKQHSKAKTKILIFFSLFVCRVVHYSIHHKRGKRKSLVPQTGIFLLISLSTLKAA